jgi:hypothetical protein
MHSQNRSESCDACFPNKSSKFSQRQGLASLRNKMQEARSGVTEYRLRVLLILYSGHAIAVTILRTSPFQNLNKNKQSESEKQLKLQEKPEIDTHLLSRT